MSDNKITVHLFHSVGQGSSGKTEVCEGITVGQLARTILGVDLSTVRVMVDGDTASEDTVIPAESRVIVSPSKVEGAFAKIFAKIKGVFGL